SHISCTRLAADCERDRVVKSDQGKELAAKYKCQYMEVSAKTGQNVEKAIQEMILLLENRVVKYPKTGKEASMPPVASAHAAARDHAVPPPRPERPKALGGTKTTSVAPTIAPKPSAGAASSSAKAVAPAP